MDRRGFLKLVAGSTSLSVAAKPFGINVPLDLIGRADELIE